MGQYNKSIREKFNNGGYMVKEAVKSLKLKMLYMILIAVVTGLMIVAQAYLIVHIIDRIYVQELEFHNVINLLYALSIVLLLRVGSRAAISRMGTSIAMEVKVRIRTQLLNHFSSQSIIDSTEGKTGEKTSVFMDTVDEVDKYFSQYLPQVMQAAVIPMIVLITIFTEHWATGVIVLITAPFIFVYMIVIGVRTGDKSKDQMKKMAGFSGIFLDNVQGLRTIKFFGQTSLKRKQIKEASLQFRDATMNILKVAFTSSLALEFISMLSIGIIALEVAIRMIIIQDTSFVTGFLMLILAPEIFTKLKDLGAAFHSGKASKGAMDNLDTILSENDKLVNWGNKELTNTNPPIMKLDNINYTYETGFSLKAIDITIQSYEMTAIIGATGSGKSTLLNVLAGLYAIDKGAYTIDAIPLKHLDQKSWFSQISLITQDAYLFSGTILENIIMGEETDPNDKKLNTALQEAGIYKWIKRLPQEIQTEVGEGGRGLSGGEKQRVLMARAFYKKPKVVLLDEPTVGLDLETETILQESIQKLRRQSTIIIVAHRLYTIKQADNIILLENGRIRSSGNHETLWKEDNVYKSMVTTQQEEG